MWYCDYIWSWVWRYFVRACGCSDQRCACFMWINCPLFSFLKKNIPLFSSLILTIGYVGFRLAGVSVKGRLKSVLRFQTTILFPAHTTLMSPKHKVTAESSLLTTQWSSRPPGETGISLDSPRAHCECRLEHAWNRPRHCLGHSDRPMLTWTEPVIGSDNLSVWSLRGTDYAV